MEFRKPEPYNIDEAVTLALQEYKKEAAINPSLKPEPDISMLKNRIGSMFRSQWNLAAFEDGCMIGYLSY